MNKKTHYYLIGTLKLEESTSTVEIFQNTFARLLNSAKKFGLLHIKSTNAECFITNINVESCNKNAESFALRWNDICLEAQS